MFKKKPPDDVIGSFPSCKEGGCKWETVVRVAVFNEPEIGIEFLENPEISEEEKIELTKIMYKVKWIQDK